MNLCKNCDYEFDGNYCNHCGQPKNIQKFTLLYFLKETFFSSLDIEGGFFSTIKELSIRPGQRIREYLNGRRLSLYVPGKFLLIFGAIATFIAMRYQVVTKAADTDLPYIFQLFQSIGLDTMGFFNYAEEFTTLVNIFAIPVFSIFTWLFFKKGYNYAENLVLNTYITAMQLVVLVILSPLIVLYPTMQPAIIGVYSVVTLIYNVWVVLAFFGNYRWISFLKVGAALLCSFIGQFVFNYLIYLVIGEYTKFLEF